MAEMVDIPASVKIYSGRKRFAGKAPKHLVEKPEIVKSKCVERGKEIDAKKKAKNQKPAPASHVSNEPVLIPDEPKKDGKIK